MGYTHYWRTKKVLATPKIWKLFASDVKKIFDYSQNQLGIALADGVSTPGSRPLISKNEILFNGSEEQEIGVWTTDQNISIPWPSPTASLTPEAADPVASKTEGSWFAGDLVSQRVSPLNKNGKGSGSYETFCLDRIAEGDPSIDGSGKHFNCTKTAYRPYDLIVTAVLIAAKKHFGFDITINSDGEEKDWLDGRILCNNVLGYGMEVKIDEFDKVEA